VKLTYPLLVVAPLWLAVAPAFAQDPPEPAQDETAAEADQTDVDQSDAARSEVAQTGAAPRDWLETRIAIEELAEDEDFTAAMALGDRLLELAELEFGPESTSLADSHLLLADVLRRDRSYQAAEEQILTAIDILEAGEGPLSPELIEPFLQLGDNYGEAGDFASALSSYGEARNIGRRNFGLLNEDQLEIIDMMSDAADRMGEIEEAQELQLERLTLIERNYDTSSIETIEALFRYAVWLRNHSFFEEERRLYFQIERIIEEHHDDDPLLHVRVLRQRALSYRVADSGDAFGLAGLRDALEYLEEMEDPPVLMVARVLTDIGDWLVEFSRTASVDEEYLQAWQLLGQVENGEALRKEWFEDLNEVEISSLSNRGLSTDPTDPAGYVVVYFTVDTEGRTQDIEITDSRPPGFKDASVARLMREARFRPRIIDGRIVPTRRAYRFEFRYAPIESE